MKILHLSTWKTGGAAMAATRLSSSLTNIGVESQVLHMSSRLPAYFDAAIGKLTHTANPIFHSYNYFGENISAKIARFKPDIIHVHWIGAGFITPEQLASFGLPIVWTLHDLWPLCGAEHLPGSGRMFDGYLKTNRPSLDRGLDLDRYVWERKLKSFKNLNLAYVAPSHYVYDLAKQSKAISSHRLIYIPNGIDTRIYKPANTAKSHKQIILFVAMNSKLDSNKGYADFLKAVSLLPNDLRNNIEIKIVGGEITSELEMAHQYQAARVTVISSHIETLSFIAMESLSCGTPVVAYRVGGIPDLVSHQTSGYLAKPYDVKDLAQGITRIITSPKLASQYGKAGRSTVIAHFRLDQVAKQYRDLYQELI